jgi:hypothetical protein
MKGKRDSFPGYPHLKRVAQSAQYGRMELLDVNATSDGFLIGTARIGTGRAAYIHSVFLGENPACRRSATQPHDVTCDRHPENR